MIYYKRENFLVFVLENLITMDTTARDAFLAIGAHGFGLETQGTVNDVEYFNPEIDCKLLKEAISGFGTDKKTISSIITGRSNPQRQMIKVHFTSKFGEDLNKELKSKLCGNYERVLLELLMSPADYDAYQCRNAIVGIGTDEECLIEILATRSNIEIIDLRKAYLRMYNSNIQKDIYDDTSGPFRRLLFTLIQGHREENQPIDQLQVYKDAYDLYTMGVAQWMSDESRFDVILSTRSFPHLKAVFDEFDVLSQRTLEDTIKNEVLPHLRDGMLSIVKCAKNRALYFAERLYVTTKGVGTDDETLIRVMVSRSEVDMVQIKMAFEKKYGKMLNAFINDDTSGDYKNVLLRLCAGNRGNDPVLEAL